MVRDLIVLFDGIVLREVPDIKAQQQIFNISNTLRFIEDIKQTLPSELEKYPGRGVEEQELKEFLDNAKVGKLDETRYEGILTQLRTMHEDLQQKQREYFSVQLDDGGEDENEKDVESEQDEGSEEDAETIQLRDIIAKLSANIRSSTRHISRTERDLISKSLLKYIKMKKDCLFRTS